MEENVITYYPLGQKTLFMLVFTRSVLLIMMIFLLIPMVILYNYVPYNYNEIAINVMFGYIAILLLVVILTLIAGWLRYIHYGIFIDQKHLKVKKGFISEEMTGIPYRHIKDVRIERSLLNQIFGVSDIVITLSGEQEDKLSEDELVTFLPALEKDIALQIQDIILKKAQVEQINVVSVHDSIPQNQQRL